MSKPCDGVVSETVELMSNTGSQNEKDLDSSVERDKKRHTKVELSKL
jgi:hypothetical protein